MQPNVLHVQKGDHNSTEAAELQNARKRRAKVRARRSKSALRSASQLVSAKTYVQHADHPCMSPYLPLMKQALIPCNCSNRMLLVTVLRPEQLGLDLQKGDLPRWELPLD